MQGESIILLRNGEKKLRAFYNVCRHRGARLCAADESGASLVKGGVSSKFITCPYHAWIYDLNGQLVLLAILAIVVGIAVVAFVPKFRNPVVAVAKTTWEKIGPLLKSPRRLISVVLANLLVQLLFSLAMYTVLRAFGQDVGFADVVLVNESVALFAGLMPVPGGVGVTEAALTGGFTAIGVDSPTAIAAALCYRLVTFYVPPFLGYFAMRSLRKQRIL